MTMLPKPNSLQAPSRVIPKASTKPVMTSCDDSALAQTPYGGMRISRVSQTAQQPATRGGMIDTGYLV
eukprot:2642573-Amphidinium_carterae.2